MSVNRELELNNIYISSDFLMTKEKEQYNNLKWMFDLLRRPINGATNINPEKFTSSLNNKLSFSRIEFFNLSGIELDIHDLQFFFDEKKINKASIDYLKTFIPENSLVIGYELSLQTRKILTIAKITYIDMWLHPIRFLDDILFGFSSNNEEIFSKLIAYDLDKNIYNLYADRLKIQSYKGFKRNNFEIGQNSALFVGQTLQDKAICRHGKMLTVLDFKDDFIKTTKSYDTVYYSRHPFVKSGDEEILKFLKDIDNVKIIDWPVYGILASENIKYVFSVSSSVVHEARAFNKKTKFLYKPIFNLNTNYNVNSYISVYHEFISPHFWADILKPIVNVNNVNPVRFINEKDKLRDMLSFYWSYGAIDKTEMMRKQLNAVDNKLQKNNSIKNIQKNVAKEKIKKIKEINRDEVYLKLENKIKEHKVISFDIFDTLLVRPFAKPDDMFEFMQTEVNEITTKLVNFREIRLNARKKVSLEKYKGEEVPLIERYKAIGIEYKLTDEQVIKLYELELKTEFELLRPRKFVKDLFDLALKNRKKVIIISDTFFDKEFIEKLLSKNGISGYNDIFVSSEVGLLKATSNIYPFVLEKVKCKPKDLLHIGDNHTVDIVNSKKYGIDSIYVESTIKSFENNMLLGREIKNSSKNVNTIIKGLLANKLCNNPMIINSPTYTNGNFVNFGYSIFGPILLGFSQWVLNEAKNDNIDKLFYLSRDGEIVYKASKILNKKLSNNIELIYLYGSRRGLNVPVLKSKKDLISMLDINFSPMKIGALIEQRFGLSQNELNLSNHELLKYGFDSLDDQVHYNKDKEKVEKFILYLSNRILENACLERQSIKKYYMSKKVFDKTVNKAIVDVGHNGTMQSSIMKLESGTKINGYYFSTYKGIDSVNTSEVFGKGYYANRLSAKDNKDHPYLKYILMFEMLFLNDQGSFIKMVEKNDIFHPIKHDITEELARVESIKEIHKGALEFISDFTEVFQDKVLSMNVNADELVAPYIKFLSCPAYNDVKIFDKIVFENKYSGRDSIPLINSSSYEKPIWLEGDKIYKEFNLLPYSDEELSKVSTIFVSISKKYGLMSENKINKFIRSPDLFFSDSSNFFVRTLGKKIKKYI